jgi:hypothetical protein
MMSSADQAIFKLGFEISPIILVNGVAAMIPGQMLPILALTQAGDFTLGLLSGGTSLPTSLDQYFAHWKPLPGTTLINNSVGQYPFANQAVAANAVIQGANTISMVMACPAQLQGAYTSKLATMTALQKTLQQHNATGGYYTVATPSQIYPNCLLLRVADVSSGDSKQVQYMWQFDFIQPLLTVDQLAQVYNGLMSKIAGGLPTGSDPSWNGQVTGANFTSSGGTILPSATNLVGASVSMATTTAVPNSYGFASQ